MIMKNECEKCGMRFDGNTCPNCGEKIRNNAPDLRKRPLLEKALFILPVMAAVILVIVFALAITNGSAKKQGDEAVNELQASYDDLTQKYDDLTQKYDGLKKEYAQYKERMKPYEGLDLAEAEARRIEAEKVAADKKAAEEAAATEKRAAEEAAAAEAAAAKAAEEAAGYETGITYDQLARTPGDFIGKKVKFYGKVIQTMENGTTVQIRLAVDDNYDSILLGEYLSSIVSSRILENDYITVYGVSSGTISYESTLGSTVTIPGVVIEKIDQ